VQSSAHQARPPATPKPGARRCLVPAVAHPRQHQDRLVEAGQRPAPRRVPARGVDFRQPAEALFAGEDQLSSVVMERMLAGLATRRHTAAGEPVGRQVSVGHRDQPLSDLPPVYCRDEDAAGAAAGPGSDRSAHQGAHGDGEHLAEHLVVVALAITADGTKMPVGLWEGSTENATVVKGLLADLVARGLDASDGLLVVIDGAKALSSAVKAVFGAAAVIQRCTVHKRRNVADHLPEAERGRVDTKLCKIFANPDPAAGLRDAKALAAALARKHPGAAASLREGLDEMFTVTRLGITGRLAKTLTTSNPAESMISVARATNRNATRWRDGQMVLRWTATGMLNAQRSFRRIKGYKQMPQLVAALHRHAHPRQRATMSRDVPIDRQVAGARFFRSARRV
jgi:putative transposase